MSTTSNQIASLQKRLKNQQETSVLLGRHLGEAMAENSSLREYVKRMEREIEFLGGHAPGFQVCQPPIAG